jgi:hypothetical protein
MPAFWASAFQWNGMICQENLRFFAAWNGWNVPWNGAAQIGS